MSLRTDTDVIIVGAGFAGVTAARELTQSGLRVVLLEARDRLGGRTWTKDTDLGRRLDLGGTWVHWIQPHVWAEIVRYDLDIVASPVPEKAYWLSGGEVHSGEPDELFGRLDPGMMAILEGAMTYFPNPHQPFPLVPELKDLDHVSMRDKLNQMDLGAEEAELLDGMWALNFNSHLENAAFTQGLRWCALAGGNWQLLFEACAYYKLRDGTKALLDAIAADTTADVRTSAVARRIEQTDEHAVVTLDDGTRLTAREVIVTLPLNALNTIGFEPPLDPIKMAASDQGQASQGVKVWLRIAGHLPSFVALASGRYPITFAQLEYHVDDDSLVVAFGPDASQLDISDRDAVQAGIRQWLPDAEVLAVEGHDWVADRFSQQTWPMLRPGQLTGALEQLQQPEGRVRLAGSDYANGWAGFIDGAIESAKTNARRVMARLSAAG